MNDLTPGALTGGGLGVRFGDGDRSGSRHGGRSGSRHGGRSGSDTGADSRSRHDTETDRLRHGDRSRLGLRPVSAAELVAAAGSSRADLDAPMSAIGSPAAATRCMSRPRSSLATRLRTAASSMVCELWITGEIASERHELRPVGGSSPCRGTARATRAQTAGERADGSSQRVSRRFRLGLRNHPQDYAHAVSRSRSLSPSN
jgi:hypothetical protein